MKIKYIVALAAGAAMTSSSVFANSAGETYVGGQIARATYDASGVPDADPTVAVLRAGHFIIDNFAIEGRLGAGISDDTIRVMGVGVDVEVDYIVGLYGVGHLPLGDVVSVYGLAGFTQGEATVKALGYSETDDDSGFSYGVGLQARFTPTLSGNIEYMSYLDKSDYDVTAISAGLSYHF